MAVGGPVKQRTAGKQLPSCLGWGLGLQPVSPSTVEQWGVGDDGKVVSSVSAGLWCKFIKANVSTYSH